MADSRNGLYGQDGASFEESFGRLQQVVQKLSQGSLTLEEALSSFEEGMALADRCARMLDEAELRLKQVGARAAHTAAEALVELEQAQVAADPVRAAAEDLNDIDAAIRQSPLIDDDTVLSVEVETYERRVTYGPSGQPRVVPSGQGGGQSGATPQRGEPVLDLDPLFDEDE